MFINKSNSCASFLVFVFSLSLSLFAGVANAQTTVTLPKGLQKKGGSHPAVLRSQDLQVDFSSLKGDLSRQRGAKKSLRIKAFSNLTIDTDIELKDVVSASRGTYVGKVRKGGDAYVSVSNDAVVIDLELKDRHVQIRPTGGGRYVSEEYDIYKYPTMLNDEKDSGLAGDVLTSSTNVTGTTTTAGDAASLVDILIVFSSDSAAALGGIDGATAFADNAAANFNTASTTSLVGTMLRVVGVVISSTASSGVVDTDWNRFTTAGDGYYDEVTAARSFYGADLVSLMTESGGGICGVGQVPGAHTVVNRGCAIGNRSFAHEVGHNFGCGHDRENASTTTTAYSYGWRFVGQDGATYRTTMAYAPGSRIGIFSNPNVTYQGVATGVAGTADNARRMVEYSNTIANYMQAVTPPTGSYINFSANTLSFGSVNIGDSKSLRLTVTNYGGSTITLTGISFLGGGEFASPNAGGCLVTLSSFGTCSFDVVFSSAIGGTFDSSVVVTASGAMNSPASARLSAAAVVPTPNIVVSGSLSFPRTSVGSSSTAILRVSNNGTAVLNVSDASLVDAGGGVFSVVSNSCTGVGLAPGSYCDVTLRFAPLVSGSYVGRVSVTSNDPDQGTVNVGLSGATGKGGGGGGSGGRKGR